MAVTKIHPIKSTLKKALDYIENPVKTDEKILVSSFACSYETADAKLYKGRKQTTKRGLLTTKQAEYQAPEKCGLFSLFCCPGFPKGIPLAHDFACKV